MFRGAQHYMAIGFFVLPAILTIREKLMGGGWEGYVLLVSLVMGVLFLLIPNPFGYVLLSQNRVVFGHDAVRFAMEEGAWMHRIGSWVVFVTPGFLSIFQTQGDAHQQ
ncbi:MAG: hypothetical protein QW734_03925 [Candidatus Bathyarchaeia archaeon]